MKLNLHFGFEQALGRCPRSKGGDLSLLRRGRQRRRQELEFPTPKLHEVGLYFERWGILMDRAPDAIDDETAAAPEKRLDANSMAELHASLHACSGSGLPSLRNG